MARKQLGATPTNTTDTLIKSYLDARLVNTTGKVLTVSNSLTLAGTDATTMTFPGTSDTVVTLGATQSLTHKNLTDATNTFPTLNQSTTGNAATATKLATARTISGVSFDGSANISLTRIGIPETVTVSSASTLTLTTASSAYVYSGAVATAWTLPAVSGNTGVVLTIENRATASAGVITLNRAGTDNIWFLSALTAIPIAQGGSLVLVNDGTYWNALSVDLTNNAIGTLPAANGGTGQTSLTSLPLTTPTITGYTETVNALGTVTSTKTIPALSSGTVLTATLTASTACTFTMPTATAGQSFVLLLKQAATTGGGTATFTGVKWSSAGTPTQTSTAASMDIYTFVSDGTDWYGSYAQGYVP